MTRNRETYQHRIERLEAKGFSRSQARGHARAGESRVSTRARLDLLDSKLELVLKTMRRGESLAVAASQYGVGQERTRAYIKRVAGAERRGSEWTFNDQRRRRVAIYSGGERRDLWVPSYEQARLAGRYWDAAHALLDEPGRLLPDFQREFDGLYVRDVAGRRHFFELDPNHIYRLAHAYPEPFEQIYQLVAV